MANRPTAKAGKGGLRLPIAATIAILGFSATALADDISEGQRLAEVNCAGCHAIGVTGKSPFKDAPPFRDIAANSTEAELEDAFNEGVASEHPAMPDWNMTPDQARQLATYIMSLAPAGNLKTELE